MKRSVGQRGEAIAETYLKRNGYRILGRNVVLRGLSGKQIGELDIVARKGKDIVFVEVKSGEARGKEWRPELHMTTWKLERLCRAARTWLSKNRMLGAPWQIDTIAVEFPEEGKPKLRHIQRTAE